MDKFELFYKLSPKEAKICNQEIYFGRPQMVDIMESIGDELQTPENLRYYKEPKAASYPLDLYAGFEEHQFRDPRYHHKHLNKVEKYLMNNIYAQQEQGDDTLDMSKIITRRSVLHRLMMTPYLYRTSTNDWTIFASKFQDVLYCDLKEEHEECSQTNPTAHIHHCKFEQYCFSESPITEAETALAFDENRRTFCVYRNQLKNFEILYSAEINGVLSEHEIKDLTNFSKLNRCNFVVTKLLRESLHSWQNNFKTLKWWTQSYLTNAYDIYVGFRNKNGLIHKPVEHVIVNDLVDNQKWKPNVCFNFLHKFLTMLQKKMSHVNCPYTVYEIQFDSIKQCINYKIHEGYTELSFLSEEFVEFMRKK